MTAERTKEVAETIMAQLGGKRFSAMTGSKSYSSGNFGKGDEYRPGLSFRVGRNPKGVMGVKVTLEKRMEASPATPDNGDDDRRKL